MPNISDMTKALPRPWFEKWVSGVPFFGWDAKRRRLVSKILSDRSPEEWRRRWKAVEYRGKFLHALDWIKVYGAYPNHLFYPGDNVWSVIASGDVQDVFREMKKALGLPVGGFWREDFFCDVPADAVTIADVVRYYNLEAASLPSRHEGTERRGNGGRAFRLSSKSADTDCSDL